MKRLLFFFLFSLLANYSFSQNQDKLIAQTQITESGADEIVLIWWIPVEFWELTFKNDPSISEAQANEIISVLKPYAFLAIADGDMSPFGTVTYVHSDSIRQTLTMNVNEHSYSPIEEMDILPDVENLLAAMKPVLKNMLGQLGQNLNFYVFSDYDEDGARIFDPLTDKKVSTSYLGKSFSWRTPIGALLPEKSCPKENYMYDGSWTYCPYHGVKLVVPE